MTARLIPVDVTERAQTIRDGRPAHREVWAAQSRDGVWEFEREEDEGTSWTVVHVPSGWTSFCHGSLRSARRFVSAGHALDQVADAVCTALRAAWLTGGHG